MDYHALQQKLFSLDPSDPREDLAKLQAAANGGGADVAPTKDYIAESAEVPQGSMPLDINSISDFAALAGVRIDEKQKIGSSGQAKGKDTIPAAEPGRTKHPLKDKLVGEAEEDRITALERRIEALEAMLNEKYKSDAQRKAVWANKTEKKKTNESIKDSLYAKLAEYELKK